MNHGCKGTSERRSRAMTDMDFLHQMRPEHAFIDISGWDKKKWLDYRQGGIGCSEIGTILGYNKWDEPALLYSKKLGISAYGSIDNQAMYWGREWEPKLMEKWQFLDPEQGYSFDSMKENEENDNIVRKVVKPEIYARNKRYPWLFGGPDGLFSHEEDMAVLEIKTISSMVRHMYKNGYPPAYDYQIQAYMMLFDVDYAELMLFILDKREIVVLPFKADKEKQLEIEAKCKDFWRRVKGGMKGVAANNDEVIDYFAPPPVDEFLYEKYLNERFINDPMDTAISTPQVDFWIARFESFKRQESLAKIKKIRYSNRIKKYMRNSSTLLSENYQATWKDYGNRKVFKVKQLEPIIN